MTPPETRRNRMTTPTKFQLGRLLITPNAQQSLHPMDVYQSLNRHALGDWGDCDEEDWERNEESLEHELRIFSVYHDRNGVKFWVITEANRASTTVLLPEDY